MEEKKKLFGRENTARHENNGQRISVRPGNFNPPAEQKPASQKPAQPAQGEQANAGNAASNGGGAGRNRRGRNRHHGDRRPQQGGEQQRNPQQNQQNEQRKPAPVEQQRPAQGEQQSAGGRNRRGRNRRGGKNNQQQQPAHREAPVLSPTLQRELDEEFSTPTLGSFTSLSTEKPRETIHVADTEEFAVDIATASYLVEDVPCGFPIPDGKAVEVVGVRFRHAGRIYFFAPAGHKFAIGDRAIVDTARGPELGDVVMLNRKIAEKHVIQPLRSVLRRATPEDEAHEAENREKEAEALKICAERIAQHKLDMRLVEAQYTFDNSKLMFYFTSEGRVDFRELVRDLAGCFHTRIELRQIGIRDESRLIGGLGMCGRPFCCATFLSDFGQVSVKMAKEQGLSINASKISGCCGRLMCCLRYEQETYAAEAKLTPKKDTVVDTPDGRGTVIDSTPLAGTVKVKLEALPEEPPRVYHRDTVVPVLRERPAPAPKQSESDAQQEE